VIKDGSDFVKVYSLLSRDSYLAIADESKKRKIPFEGHVPEEVSASEASDIGQMTFEHLYGILKACSSKANDKSPTRILGLPREKQREVLTQILDTYDEKRATDLFKKLKKNNTWQCPTINVLEAMSRPGESRTWTEYRFDYLPAWFRNVWSTYKDRSKDWTAADYELNNKYFQKQLDVVRDMHKAGVPLLAGTDVMNPYCFPGFSLHDELRWFVKAGIKPYDVLKIATLNPAKFIGKQKEFGTVERGKVADLVLLDANPLDDIYNTTKINAVIRDGVLYDRVALDKLMPKDAAKAQSPQGPPPIAAGLAEHEH
jgi:imidazolonepropionase-like amidohydrolase